MTEESTVGQKVSGAGDEILTGRILTIRRILFLPPIVNRSPTSDGDAEGTLRRQLGGWSDNKLILSRRESRAPHPISDA